MPAQTKFPTSSSPVMTKKYNKKCCWNSQSALSPKS